MSVITTVDPHTILSDHDWPCRPPGEVRPDRRYERSPAPRRRGSWEDQFVEIVSTLLPRLQRLARRILHSDDLADDAVQEALLSLWNEGRLPPNPEGWLIRTVVHRSLHLNRCRRRRRAYEERASTRRTESDPGGDASQALEAEEVALTIAAVLRALPEHLRTVFLLREVEQLDYESIAAALGVPVGTVRSRLFRAREALRDVLTEALSA